MFATRRFLVFFIFLFFFGAKSVWASCAVSVSPNNVTMGTSSVSTFTVSNTSEQMGNWVRIQSPGLTAYTVANMEAAGWYPNGGGTEANFAGGYLEGGTNANFALTLAETGEVVESMSWEALLSYDDGANFESCGSVLLQIVPAPTPPTISNTSLTVGNSSATLTWSTNLTATGAVNYGITSGYGSSVVTASGTTHTASMTGLSASTEYHYQIQVTSAGGMTSTTDATFTTSAADVVTTTTTTVTSTTTNIVTNTNTVTRVLIDRVAPKISILTKFDRPLESAPAVSGRVVDGGEVNAGVAAVEYSIDGGKNWAKVDEIDNLGGKVSGFEFVPPVIDDGSYKIKVRARDLTGNIGNSAIYTLVIDRLPPETGGSIFSVGPIILKPDGIGNIYGVAGMNIKIALSAVGGPTSMDLFWGGEKYILGKNEESGLWSTELNLKNEGNLPLVVKAIDGAKNETERKINNLISLAPGKVMDTDKKPIDKARLNVYTFEKNLNDFIIWEGEPFFQSNPQVTKSDGSYQLLLPAGKYFVEIESWGKRKIRSEIFEIGESTFLTQNFEMGKSILGNWWAKTVSIDQKKDGIVRTVNNSLVGKMLPDFDIVVGGQNFGNTNVLGKPTVMTFLSSWGTETSDQIMALDSFSVANGGVNTVAVLVQESASKAEIFKKIGGYGLTILADSDGVLVKPLNLMSLPTHVFLDRKGIIKEVSVGYLSEPNLLNKILN